MFWFGLSKITVELISSGAALLIIFVFLFLILEVSKIILSLILPERIFFFVFFPVHKVIHFGASSFSETHLLYGVVFGRQWLWWRLLVAVVLIRIRVFILALLGFIFFWEFFVVIVLGKLLLVRVLFIFIQLRFRCFCFFAFFIVDFLLFDFFFGRTNFFCLFFSLRGGI